MKREMNSDPYDIIGIGVSTLDLLMIADEFPGAEGVQKAHNSLLQGGGPVATALVTAARLGARTAMIDYLGDDWRGRQILSEFKEYKVDIDYIKVLPGKTSTVSSIVVRKRDGRRAIIFSPGTACDVPIDELPRDAIETCKIIHMNGRHLGASLAATKIAKNNGCKISFDGGAGRYRPALDEILSFSNYMIASEEFCAEWLGKAEPEILAEKIVDRGAELAVVTMGDKGSLAKSSDGELKYQKAYHVEPIVDTTGCGDVYHGAFLYGLVSGFGLEETMEIASAAAALKATKLGGRGLIADLARLREFMAATPLRG